MTELSKKIAFNTLSQIIGKTFSTALGVAITVILTRYLGPAGFGQYTFVIVFVTMFGTISDWGLSLIGVREASQKPGQAAETIGNIVVVRLALSLIALAAANGAAFFLSYESSLRQLILIGSVFLILNSVKTSFQIIFNFKMQMQNWAISEAVANLTALVIILFLVMAKATLVEILWAFNAGHLMAALAATILGIKLFPLKISLVSAQTRHLFFEALPMGAILVVFTIYNRVDTIILAGFKGSAPVGFYGAAYRVFEVLVLGAAYFSNSILPLVSKLAATNNEKLNVVYGKSFVVLLGLGILVAVANFLLAPLAILIIAGPEFSPATGALRILSLALIVSYFNHLNGYTLVALGKQWYSLGIAAVALIVNVCLNIVLIPTFSLYGAAFVTFLTEAVIMFLSMYVLFHTKRVHLYFSDVLLYSKEILFRKGQIFS